MCRACLILGIVATAAASANASIVIIDDHGVGEQGTGTFSISNSSKPRVKSGMYHPGGSGNGCYLLDTGYTATWTPTLTAGTWLVEVWNPTDATAIVTNTTTVVHAGGSTGYVFKQTDAGGHWAGLGFHAFSAGTGGYVTITGVKYGYADAVRFSSADEQIAGAFGLGQSFAWSQDGHWSPAKTGNDYVTNTAGAWLKWTIDVVPGTYDIDFRYLYDDNRSPDTVVQVWDGATQLGGDTVVNQHGSNPDPLQGVTSLGQYTFTGSTAEVRVVASGNHHASALGVEVAWVPEPGTLALLALGGLSALKRRRKA